ncbi:MAG: hypothetical protein MJK18_14020 [Bdellovibrionales bacterium]|nr:hypothetical protein [Bdellovibrionales bacterium]
MDYITKDNECIYYRCEGPTQLCMVGHELPGHDKDYHSHGFSSPLGYVKGYEDCLSWASAEDLETLGLVEGQVCTLEFESGVTVTGKLDSTSRTPRRELCLMTWTDCTVKFGDKLLFDPSWGTFDMAVGSKVQSVFAGPADRKSYGMTDNFAKKIVPKREINDSELKLNASYQRLRDLRKSGEFDEASLTDIFNSLDQDHNRDWLARLEIVELTYKKDSLDQLRSKVIESLEAIKAADPKKSRVIDDGLTLANKDI